MTKTKYLKTNSSQVVKQNYVKYLDLINYGKQETVFTETLVYAVNITSYSYWNVTIKLRSPETLSLS